TTSGSTPTTSRTATAGPTTSRPGGTSSTGKRSRSATRRGSPRWSGERRTERSMRALVTGGRGRVGEAIVRRLERDGWRVFAAGRADGDVSRPGEARTLVERALQELGGLDLLVNAAGEGFAPKPFEQLDEADWDT